MTSHVLRSTSLLLGHQVRRRCVQQPPCSRRTLATQVEKVKPAEEGVGAQSSKIRMQPVVKSAFLGKVDPRVLTFPELDGEALTQLKGKVGSLEGSANDLRSLGQKGLCGVQVPQAYGGTEATSTEYVRMVEAVGGDASVAVMLHAHQALGIKSLLLEGNEQQRSKYLPLLSTAEWIAAFCLNESDIGSDVTKIKAQARLSDDGTTWTLNATKPWVVNGGNASLYVVFAQTEMQDHKHLKYDALTAFIVERDYPGVTVKSHGTPGINGADLCSVQFKDTPVPAANTLGTVGQGLKLAVNAITADRFCWGGVCSAMLRDVLKYTVEHARTDQLTQAKLAKMAVATYAVESATYMTAGLIDTTDADTTVESTAVKLMATDALWTAVVEALSIVGSPGYDPTNYLNRIMQDARALQLFETSSDVLRSYVALAGLHFAGLELQDDVKKMRNPLFHPGFIFRKTMQRIWHHSDNPKVDMGLDGFVHPSLKKYVKMLEYCVARLEFGVEQVFAYHGAEVAERHMVLRRLSDVAVMIYGMTAVLARSSRSYCIGLRNADLEITLAQTYCCDAYTAVKRLVNELNDGQFATTDTMYMNIAEKIVSHKGYQVSHPLERNF